MGIEQTLRQMGIDLANLPPAAAFGAYVPAKRVGKLIYVSGQLPMRDGKLIATGPVPSRCTIEQAKEGARWCVANALIAVHRLEGTLNGLKGVVRVGAFVASDATFTQQPQVANGASELLIEMFGDSGKHVRAAVGTSVLPLDASVEIEFIFETK
jgi:enamine deaminase RidA (YjgF/YER057c/UK114 family)